MIGSLNKNNRQVTVLGAGISGLVVAYYLDQAGYEVTLIENKNRTGGLIQTSVLEHGMAESAIHTFLASPVVRELMKDLKIELCEVRANSKSKWILREGKKRKLPLTPFELISTLRKVFTHPVYDKKIDLETWGKSYIGESATRWLLSPAMIGIYGARAADLQAQAIIPELMPQPGESLFQALRRLKKAKNKEKRPMVAPLFGMESVVRALEEKLKAKLGDRFNVNAEQDDSILFNSTENVILTVPAYELATLFSKSKPVLARAFSNVLYTPMISMTAIFRRCDFDSPPRGVGVLIPPQEGFKTLGVLFTSSSFPGRVKDESQFVSLTFLMGGAFHPELLQASDEDLLKIVVNDSHEILGARSGPLEWRIHRWPRAIPLYGPALVDAWERAREEWCTQPGRVIFGNHSGSVSFRGMIEDAYRLSSY